MKNIHYLLTIFLLSSILSSCSRNRQQELLLWYDEPAKEWNEALPVGNGRLGAMVFGNPFKECIQLNEESLWSGLRFNSNNQKALENLPELRSLILSGNLQEAYQLANTTMVGTPRRIRSYQTAGELEIHYNIKDTTGYRRSLDLNTGITSTEFSSGNTVYRQEVFASAPDNVIVIHLKASRKGTLDATFSLNREKDAETSVSGNGLYMKGQVIDMDDPLRGPGGKHMKFAAQARIISHDGKISTKGNLLEVKGAGEILMLYTAATDYDPRSMDFDRTKDPEALCSRIMEQSKNKNYKELYRNHIKEYSEKFHRVSLELEDNGPVHLPTDERLNTLKKEKLHADNGLIVLYFQYGRYLLMSSSRAPGVLPANLQGIWNRSMKAVWGSDFHTNINLQMNYWPAEVCNLSETALPLSSFLYSLQKTNPFWTFWKKNAILI